MMVRIELDIPRPGSLLFWMSAIAAVFFYANTGTGKPEAPAVAEKNAASQSMITAAVGSVPPEGGAGIANALAVQQAEQDAKALRIKQEILSRREDILREELQQLEAVRSNDPELQEELIDARDRLTALLVNKHAAELELANAFSQIWEAQGFAMRVSVSAQASTREVSFVWPVKPMMGISAEFDDAGYQKLFGMPHQAVDIPVPQGTVVRAAADGVIAQVKDNGMGFNSVIIKHTDGFATLYGHVSKFLVSEGDDVYAGDAIALSGGLPGTPGAGHMTTGAHLHLQLIKDGSPVDPLPYLPSVGE